MEKSTVYFTDFRCHPGLNQQQKLRKLLLKAGMDKIDFQDKFVAIKMHFGELGNLAYLRPNYAKTVADLVKELGGKLVVARASNDVHAKFLLRNGADQIFYPEKQVADWAAIKCSSEHILDFMELGGNFALFEVDVPDQWVGRTIGELDIRRRHHINIIGKKQNGMLDITLSPETVFNEGETILVLGTKKDFYKTFKV